MIVIAGRAAKPPLPFGSFYPRDCSILGFAMFNASPDEQAPRAAEDIAKWAEAGRSRPRSARPSPSPRPPRPTGSSTRRPSRGRASSIGKVVIEID